MPDQVGKSLPGLTHVERVVYITRKVDRTASGMRELAEGSGNTIRQ
jgi:hypothetical protein